jgi:hypothetical protein
MALNLTIAAIVIVISLVLLWRGDLSDDWDDYDDYGY